MPRIGVRALEAAIDAHLELERRHTQSETLPRIPW